MPWTFEELKNPSQSIHLPGFRAAFNSAETQSLRKRYFQARNTLTEYYKGKNFLEATLRLLTS